MFLDPAPQLARHGWDVEVRGPLHPLANTNAELIIRFKDFTENGGVIERLVWRVLRPVPPTNRCCK